MNSYHEFRKSLNDDPKWRKTLESSLNPAQLAFATCDDDALLGLAGPGSGKTRALVYRAAHLLKTGLPDNALLLLTFTNKAAGEMKDRLAELLGFLPRELWAGTFHSIGARILRRHASLVGRSANFSILDEDDSRAMLKAIIAELGLSDDDRKQIMQRGFLGRVISQARNSGMTIREVMEEDYDYRLHYLDTVSQSAEMYQSRKRENNCFDFDDLLICWLDLFEQNPVVRDHYRNRFSQVLVDEFQDTNVIQARIIDLFSGSASICAVGDDAQSIYAFRYANIGNILNFPERYNNCEIVRMEQNYRSTPEIVKLANCSINNNRQQLKKELYSRNPGGDKPLIATVHDARQEAAFVLQTIWDLQNNCGIALNEIAVLYRSSFLTPEVEFALARRGIPYRTYGGMKFFQKAHIKDVLAYLKIINNPSDAGAWRRVAILQKGIGPAGFDKFWLTVKDSEDPLETVLDGETVPSRGKKGWEELVKTLGMLVKLGPKGVPNLLSTVVENNYDSILRRDYADQYEERLRGIERLMIYGERFDTLPSFLESLALEESVFADTAGEGQGAGEHLTLSTVHSAKGKEWDAVIIIGVNQGHFPGSRVDGKSIDEERRLFYVAATRARRFLYMVTYREDYRNYGASSEGPSLFLRELPADCYQVIDYDDGY